MKSITARLISLATSALPRISKKNLVTLGLIFCVYTASAWFGNRLFINSGMGWALIWPPAGISVAALFLKGSLFWPAIALGSLVNSALTGDTPIFSTLMIAFGNTAQALAGVEVLKRFDFNRKLSTLKDILVLFLVAFVASVIAPTVGMLSLTADFNLNLPIFFSRWISWWLGGVLSIFSLTPFLVSWAVPLKIKDWKAVAEGMVAFITLFVVEYFLFWEGVNSIAGISLIYIMLAPLFWIALRFGPKSMTLAIFIMAIVSISGVHHQNVNTIILDSRLMQIELFTIIVSMILFIMSSISEERKRAAETLLDHIDQLEEALETIRHHAMHDTLTGLANRKALEERFELARSMAVRHGHKLALMFLDLDQFKNINDTLGHSVGDIVLKETAARISGTVREIDTVARLGGDEFIIILNEIDRHDDAMAVAQKLVASFKDPLGTFEQDIYTTPSIGIAIYPEAGEDIDTLLKSADIALYRAKERGRNNFQFYDQEMKHKLHAKLSLEQDLRHAIERQQLKLVYQPITELRTNKLVGVEALIRWAHPKHGLLSPTEFISLAEETGLIVPIGNWLIKKACKQARAWKKHGLVLPVAINLSAKQVDSNNLVETISKALDEYDLSPKYLELEITESIAMQNQIHGNKLKELEDLGVRITMDDFGTGYSSLSYLRSFHVHRLKIDQSFVKRMCIDQQDATIIRTIISMGHTLDLEVVAEGVEDSQQKMLLNSMGCDNVQGYFICPPIEASEVIEFQKQLQTQPQMA